MRSLCALLCLLSATSAAQAAIVTYRFTAVQTGLEPESSAVTGLVDALRAQATITGSIAFDTTFVTTSTFGLQTSQVYQRATVLVDGVDMTSANSRMLRTSTSESELADRIVTSFRGSVDGRPEQYDIAVFNGTDFTRSMRDGDLDFPVLLPPPSPLVTIYSFSFSTVNFDGDSFSAREGATYTLSSLTLDGPAAVPLPATSLLGLIGLGALAGVRRRPPV